MTAALAERERIRRAIRGWSLLRLEWIRRRLAVDGSAIEARPVEDLCNALVVAGEAAEPALVDPRFWRWCAELTRLLQRDAPRLLPEGRFRAACRDAGAFALAARSLLAGASGAAMPTTTVRVDHEGCVPLCGTGTTLRFGRRYVGINVPVTVDSDGYSAEPPWQPAVVPEPTPLPGLICPTGDPVDIGLCEKDPLLTCGSPCVLVERGSPDEPLAMEPGIARVPARASARARARYALAAADRLRSALESSGPPRVDEPDPVPDRPTRRLAAEPPALAETLARLGAPDGIEVNTLTDGRQRTDPTIDHLSLLKVRRPDEYSRLVAHLAAPPRTPAERLLLGHRSYVERRFASAAECYARLLREYPESIDLWRDFAFALRHLGATTPFETVIFHLSTVMERAAAHEWRDGSAPVPELMALIERVADDSDPR